MDACGGSITRGLVADLCDRITEYKGVQNEIRLGAFSGEMPEKPLELREYEFIDQFRTLWVAGGLNDQPWLHLLLYEVVREEMKTHKMLEEKANAIQS